MANPYPSGSPGVPDSSMPTGAPGNVPRRSSYASVVSGTASQYAPARSGAFSHLLNHDYSYNPSYQNSSGNSRHDPRTLDMDYTANGGGNGRSGSWAEGGHLPSFSSAFGSLVNGNGDRHGGLGSANMDQFFTPSYLKGSRYVQTLEAGYRAKVSAQKDGPYTHSSASGSLSTTPGSSNIHAKMAPSHRGITYDIIEKSSPLDDEMGAPLPSKWNIHDKNNGLEVLSDGQEVKSLGLKSERERDHEASAIRADHPMPSQCGIYYYEVTIISRKREESSIGIGFSSKNVPLSRLPGWEPESWAYHGDDGHSFCCQSSGKHYGPPFNAGDIIGCGVNFRTGSAFFTKNGDHLGTAFREIKGKLFPSVGMKKSGEHIRVNFGQSPFVFDIDGMMTASPLFSIPDFHIEIRLPNAPNSALTSAIDATMYASNINRFQRWCNLLTVLEDPLHHLYRAREKRMIRQEIEATCTAKLAPPLSETDLIQSLVLQFLTHEGYVETAKEFADEVRSEKQALSLDPNAIITGFDVKEDEDAGHRQRIRAAVLEGDVERALKYTNAYYPNVLKDNEHVYFRLRCRKFIEMIHQAAEINKPKSTNGNKKTNGQNGYWDDSIINHDMDLDEDQGHNDDRMDTEESHETNLEVPRLLGEAVAYGTDLQTEFKNDPRREVTKALEDAFALIAYVDPFNAKGGVSHLLDPSGRVAVAEELNAAILVSLGKPASAALELVIQQTQVLLEDLQEGGGPGSFVNIDEYIKLSS